MEKRYDVFISYSSDDQKVAEGICGYLERMGYRCFVAYRDIPRGVVWAAAITDAIDDSAMMVVVFSNSFDISLQTDREIELASRNKMPILTFRIADDEMTKAKKYYLTNLNWIDAFPNPENFFGQLFDSVEKLIGKIKKRREDRERAGAVRLAKEAAEKRLEEERRAKEARLKTEEERKAKAQAEAERLAKEATERKRLEEERRVEEARLKDEEEQKARERSEAERKVEEAAEYELKENIKIEVEETDLKDETIYKRGRVVFRTIWMLILMTVIVGGAVYLIGFLWRFLNFMGLDLDWWGGWETIVLCLIVGLSATLYMYFTGFISVNGSD